MSNDITDALKLAQDAAIRLNTQERQKFIAWLEQWHDLVTETHYHASGYTPDSGNVGAGEHETLRAALAAVRHFDTWEIRDDGGKLLANSDGAEPTGRTLLPLCFASIKG